MTATASSTGAAAGTATLGVKQIVTVSKTVHKIRISIRQKKNEKSMYTQFFLKDAGLLLYEDMVKQT